MYDKSAGKGVLFGPCLQPEHSNFIYPKEVIKKHETVIWASNDHKTVSLKSYERAHLENDQEALAKIASLKIPLNCSFGGLIKFN